MSAFMRSINIRADAVFWIKRNLREKDNPKRGDMYRNIDSKIHPMIG